MTETLNSELSPTDAELLTRFVASRDEAAFRQLVEKHSGLVWGVCSRQLRFREDVEDAFQTTFVMLARNAKTVKRGSSIASWLYKVAVRSAINIVRKRTRNAEQSMVEEPEVMDNVFAKLHDREQAMILDEEVSRLPEKLRSVVILCCIEGKSRAEAAAELECTDASVKSRLSRGRQLLRVRLAKRGVGLSIVLGLIAKYAEDAGAAPPASLIDATVSAGIDAPFHPPITSFADGWLHGDGLIGWLPKPLLWLAAAVLVGLAGAGLMALPQTSPSPNTIQIDEQAVSAADEKILAVLMTLEQDPADGPNDTRLNYLRAKADYYEQLAIATRLEMEAWQSLGTPRVDELNKRITNMRIAAEEKLQAATVALAEYATMRNLWGEEEATRVLRDTNIIASAPETDHARRATALAARLRRFERASDPDPMLSQINESPTGTANATAAKTSISAAGDAERAEQGD